MNDPARLAVASAFTSVHEAELARSVLEAAGIEAVLADDHLVSMTWTYSNAVGGVKVMVPEDRLDEARSLLQSQAVVMDRPPATDSEAADAISDACQQCGNHEFESRLQGKSFAILSWLTLGVPLGLPRRRRYCRRCGALAPDGR